MSLIFVVLYHDFQKDIQHSRQTERSLSHDCFCGTRHRWQLRVPFSSLQSFSNQKGGEKFFYGWVALQPRSGVPYILKEEKDCLTLLVLSTITPCLSFMHVYNIMDDAWRKNDYFHCWASILNFQPFSNFSKFSVGTVKKITYVLIFFFERIANTVNVTSFDFLYFWQKGVSVIPEEKNSNVILRRLFFPNTLQTLGANLIISKY